MQPVFEYQVKEQQYGKQMENHDIEIGQFIHQEIGKEKQSVVDVERQNQTFHSHLGYQLILHFLFAEGVDESRYDYDKSKDLIQKAVFDPPETRGANYIFGVFGCDDRLIGEKGKNPYRE